MKLTWKKRILSAAVCTVICAAFLLTGCAGGKVGETDRAAGTADAAAVTAYGKPADFTVPLTDGGSFSLSGAVEENEAVLIVLFDPADSASDPASSRTLSLVGQFCGSADRAAGLGLSVGDPAAIDGAGLPLGNAAGTGLERFAEGGLPAVLTVDRYGYLTMVNRVPPADAEEVERLTAPFLADGYVPPEKVRYEIRTNPPVSGAVFAFCTDQTCVPAPTDSQGIAVFEGTPGEYTVKLLSAPEGVVVSLPEGLSVGPHAERILVTVTEAGS